MPLTSPHSTLACTQAQATSGTQSKVTVPAIGTVAHAQLATVSGHGCPSAWEPNLVAMSSNSSCHLLT